MSENDVLTAADAQPDVVYKTADSNLSYFAKLVSKDENLATLAAFMPKSGKWKEFQTPLTYKLRGLSEQETAEFSSITSPKAKVARVPKEKKEKGPVDPLAVAVGRKGPQKVTGAVSSKGMIQCWADYIHQYVDQVGGRTAVIEAMEKEFPSEEKKLSINTWVDAYLTYYNTGRFEKQGYPRLTVSKVWQLSDAEKAAGMIQKAPKPIPPKAVVEQPTKAVEEAKPAEAAV